jgi:hypothetical protein
MSIRYVHDFGDNWVHEILVEEVLVPEELTVTPVCLEGRQFGALLFAETRGAIGLAGLEGSCPGAGP